MNNTKQKMLIGKIGGYLIVMFLSIWVLSGPIPKLVDSANNLGVAAGAVLFIMGLVANALIVVDVVREIKSMFKRREEK